MATPDQIVAGKRRGGTVVGWKLDRGRQPDELLAEVPPRYETIVADHVTLVPKVASDTPLPHPVSAQAIGQVDDGRGVQALIVEIDGGTDRPGGGTYHITWSLADGRTAKESNEALAACEWQRFDEPLPLRLVPARF